MDNRSNFFNMKAISQGNEEIDLFYVLFWHIIECSHC